MIYTSQIITQEITGTNRFISLVKEKMLSDLKNTTILLLTPMIFIQNNILNKHLTTTNPMFFIYCMMNETLNNGYTLTATNYLIIIGYMAVSKFKKVKITATNSVILINNKSFLNH